MALLLKEKGIDWYCVNLSEKIRRNRKTMEKFGEYLKNYLKENKISFVSASKICGIDRTLISKYANGTRFPKEQKDVIEMARFLKMSKKQEEAFC